MHHHITTQLNLCLSNDLQLAISYKTADQVPLETCSRSLRGLLATATGWLLDAVEAVLRRCSGVDPDLKGLAGGQPFGLDLVLTGNRQVGSGIHG